MTVRGLVLGLLGLLGPNGLQASRGIAWRKLPRSRSPAVIRFSSPESVDAEAEMTTEEEYELDVLKQRQRSDEAWRARQKARDTKLTVDAVSGAQILDPVDLLPGNLGFVGANIIIPALQQCPPELQWQPDWYQGDASKGGGICPIEALSWPGFLAGGAMVMVAAYLAYSARAMRLVVRDGGIEKRPVRRVDEEEEEGGGSGLDSISDNLRSGGNPFFPSSYGVEFAGAPESRIELAGAELNFLPLRLGLVATTAAGDATFFLGLWDTLTLRALLAETEEEGVELN